MRALFALALVLSSVLARAEPSLSVPYIFVVMEQCCPKMLPMQADNFKNLLGKLFGLTPAAIKAELSTPEAREGISAAQMKWDLGSDAEQLRACSELAQQLARKQ